MPTLRSSLVLLVLLALPPVVSAGTTPEPPRSTRPAPMTRPAPAPAPRAPVAAPRPAPTYAPAPRPAPTAAPAPRTPSYAPAPRHPQLTPRTVPRAEPAPTSRPTPSVAPAPRTPAATPGAKAAPAPAPREPKIIYFDPPAPDAAPAARAPASPKAPSVAPAASAKAPMGREPLTSRAEVGPTVSAQAPRRAPEVGPVTPRATLDPDLVTQAPRGPLRPYERDGYLTSDTAQSWVPRNGVVRGDVVQPPPTSAPHPPPVHYWYQPWYSHWHCHPYWRYTHVTWAVVWFGFDVYPYDPFWWPPERGGWVWVPGYWEFGWWTPGHWAPVRPAPVHYVYVSGAWYGDTYVEGFYRRDHRDGWEWIDGYYTDDGGYVQGYWRPIKSGPASYVWEPGFWDGESWTDGFWRPALLDGYTWVPATYDADGVYEAGYWLPTTDKPGHVWIPGWFDGRSWIDGYWVEHAALDDDAIDAWQPPETYDAGWSPDDVAPVTPPQGLPLAIPVDE